MKLYCTVKNRRGAKVNKGCNTELGLTLAWSAENKFREEPENYFTMRFFLTEQGKPFLEIRRKVDTQEPQIKII